MRGAPQSSIDVPDGGGFIAARPTERLIAKRERLGTALHELATDLARERRRNADLERENRRLRARLEAAQSRS